MIPKNFFKNSTNIDWLSKVRILVLHGDLIAKGWIMTACEVLQLLLLLATFID